MVNRMKKKYGLILVSLLVLALAGDCYADTFTNRKSGEVLHGYATHETEEGKTIVQTKEKGKLALNLAQWDIAPDYQGRNKKVIVLAIDEDIMLQIETEAFEKALIESSNEGPLFILIEIDTPGGRVDFAQRICAAITELKNCRVIAYIKGGKHGGAISAGSAVSFACDKLYMAENATIGAATMITFTKDGPKDLKTVYGDDVGEKASSYWRAYMASLAEQNGRPGLLARAMVDKDIEAIEVIDDGKRLFIEPVNKKPDQEIAHTWSKKGSLLTLTTAEAFKSGIADKVFSSRLELLQVLNASEAEIVINDTPQKARKELERAVRGFKRVSKAIDLKIKESQNVTSRPRALKILRGARDDYNSLLQLAKRYPDLNVSVHLLEESLNSVEAAYKEAKMRR